MPTKALPSKPSLEQLKHQAKDLLKARESCHLAALQRIREFHPRFGGASDSAIRESRFTLSDAQLTIAREYGFASWPRLKARIQAPTRFNDINLPHHERIKDYVFRRAVELLDSGDASGLQTHLRVHPGLVRQRVTFEAGNYFRNPTLLEFIAENPIRQGRLPANILEIAKIILEEGGKSDQAGMDSALTLVCSGRVPRECGVQVPLVDLLCNYGADPNAAIQPAIAHGEFAAVDALLRRGAMLTLPASAAIGDVEHARETLSASTAEERHRALALAAQFGRAEIVRLLLEAGEDPNRYNPVGCHSHSTPLHQAAANGHMDVVRLLVEHGASLDFKDILFGGTPLGWAEHSGHKAIADYLRAQEARTGTKPP
jgi:Ankyrin repeats (3 copies)